MNDIEAKRDAVKSVYPSRRWANKVNAMPDAQVVALYLKFKNQNKF